MKKQHRPSGADTLVRPSKKADKSVRPTKDTSDQGSVTSNLQTRRRDLPHWQQGGSVYFVTFRSARGALPPEARRLVIASSLHDHGTKYEFILGVVMPDHVHLLLRPMETSPGVWPDLHMILKSVKGVSARRINQLMGTTGTVWQDESFDRIVRDEEEFQEKCNYILNNPIKSSLVNRPEDYDFYITPPAAQVE
ncbi:MAG: transposase [candidate division Zixibacteria bacterium]|nr:transposase [candidate division Zixibacteria bacterium]